MPRVVLLDWDNTLWPGFTVLEFSTLLVTRGLIDESVPADLEAAHDAYRKKAATNEDVGAAYDGFAVTAEEIYLGGLRQPGVAQLEQAGEDFAALHDVYSSTPRLVEAIRAHGWLPVVISGAPIEPVRARARRMGIESIFAWQLLASNGTAMRGLLFGNTARRLVKERLIQLLREQATIVAGFGDADADEPLLEAALLGVMLDPPAPPNSEKRPPTIKHLAPRRDGSAAEALRTEIDQFVAEIREIFRPAPL